jgi:hypothetical protein
MAMIDVHALSMLSHRAFGRRIRPQFHQFGIAAIAQLDAVEIVPDVLGRVGLDGGAWRLFQAQPLRAAATEEVFDKPAAEAVGCTRHLRASANS